MPIDRRRLLVGIAAAMGGALSGGAARALDAALTFEPGGGYTALKTGEVTLLRAVMDTIIPATETASASGAGVDQYIDHMMANVLPPVEARKVTAFLTNFDSKHPDFKSLSGAERHDILVPIDRDMHKEGSFPASYRTIKELVFIGYFTSEVGATEELAFDPVPGPFHNGLLTEFPKTWST